MVGMFAMFKPEFKCNLPENTEPFQTWSERCQRYTPDHCYYVDLKPGSVSNFAASGATARDLSSSPTKTYCGQGNFTYFDDQFHPQSMVAELDLICEKDKSITYADTLNFIGYEFGSLLAGYISDNYGRKPSVLLMSGMHGILNLLPNFITNIEQYYVLKFIIGIFSMGNYLAVFIYMDEFLSKKERVLGNAAYASVGFATGYMIVVWAAWYFRTWRMVHNIVSCVAIPGTILAYWLLEETPAWLLANNKYKQAKFTIGKIKKRNGFESEEDIHLVSFLEDTQVAQSSCSDVQTTYTTKDLFVNGKRMRWTTINLLFCWFVCSLAYFGLSLNSASSPTDIYMTNFIYALMDYPSCFLCFYGMKKIGRKPTTVYGLVLAGILILISTYLNELAYCDAATDTIYNNSILMWSYIDEASQK